MAMMQRDAEAPRYLYADVAEDIGERLGFVRHGPQRVLLIGDAGGTIAGQLAGPGCEVVIADPADGLGVQSFGLERPWPVGGFDLIAVAFAFDTANDLPGALVHARSALAPGGLMLATMLGGGSLPALRAISLAADADRPSPRLHPQVDVRAGAQLLQRAGFADPVADSRSLAVRFSSLRRLLDDLRAQGLSSALRLGGPPFSRQGRERALAAFAGQAAPDGRVTERFELLTLSGWRRPA